MSKRWSKTLGFQDEKWLKGRISESQGFRVLRFVWEKQTQNPEPRACGKRHKHTKRRKRKKKKRKENLN